jgi:hypothetical protein
VRRPLGPGEREVEGAQAFAYRGVQAKAQAHEGGRESALDGAYVRSRPVRRQGLVPLGGAVQTNGILDHQFSDEQVEVLHLFLLTATAAAAHSLRIRSDPAGHPPAYVSKAFVRVMALVARRLWALGAAQRAGEHPDEPGVDR